MSKLPNRRQMIAGTAASTIMMTAAYGCAEAGPIDRPLPEHAAALLRDLVGKRTYNAHAHILASNWWAPPGASAEAFEGQLAAASRANKFIVKRQLKGMPAAVQKKYVEQAADRGRLWTFEEALSFYLERMDEAGIDTVFNLTMDNLPIGARAGSAYTEDFMRIMQDDHRARQSYPDRLISFAGVDPRRGPEAVRLFEEAVRDFGFAGYGEMIGSLWDVSPADRKIMYPILEKASELNVPVIIDATQDKGRSQPSDFETLAIDFPDLRICMAGAGAGVAPVETRSGPVPARDVFLSLAEKYDTLYLDLGDWQGIAAGKPPFRRNDGSSEMTIRYLHRALEGPAGRRIMFGTDYPIFAGLYSEADWIHTLLAKADELAIEFTREHWSSFFSDNPARFIAKD